MVIDRKYFELRKEVSDLISSNLNVDRELLIRVLIENAVELASQRQDSNEVDLVNDFIDEILRLFYRALDDRKHKKKLTPRCAAIL